MAQNIQLGIRLKFDGKEVEGGLSVSRDQLRQFAAEASRVGDAGARGRVFLPSPIAGGRPSMKRSTQITFVRLNPVIQQMGGGSTGATEKRCTGGQAVATRTRKRKSPSR